MTTPEYMRRLAALVPRPQPQRQLHLIRVASECAAETTHARPSRISWARRLKRLFDIDMQHRPN